MREKLLAIGLGNPGGRYANTYHNAGVLFVEYCREKFEALAWKEHRSGMFAYVASGEIIFAKSMAFMNESGQAVLAAANFFKLPPRDIVIVHDETDLPLGEFKLSFGRSAAGHKGVQSTIDILRTQNFSRLRIGVRPNFPSGKTRKKAGDFVLAKIGKSDKEKLYGVFGSCIEKLMLKVKP